MWKKNLYKIHTNTNWANSLIGPMRQLCIFLFLFFCSFYLFIFAMEIAMWCISVFETGARSPNRTSVAMYKTKHATFSLSLSLAILSRKHIHISVINKYLKELQKKSVTRPDTRTTFTQELFKKNSNNNKLYGK